MSCEAGYGVVVPVGCPRRVFLLKRALFRVFISRKFRVAAANFCRNFARNLREIPLGLNFRRISAFPPEMSFCDVRFSCSQIPGALGLAAFSCAFSVVVVKHHSTPNEVVECTVLVASEKGLGHQKHQSPH